MLLLIFQYLHIVGGFGWFLFVCFYLSSTGSSALRCDDLRAAMGGGVGGTLKKEEVYVDIQLIHFIVQQGLTGHCNAITLQSKIL